MTPPKQHDPHVQAGERAVLGVATERQPNCGRLGHVEGNAVRVGPTHWRGAALSPLFVRDEVRESHGPRARVSDLSFLRLGTGRGPGAERVAGTVVQPMAKRSRS